jgi:branched-chain amino acid transport system permease protein
MSTISARMGYVAPLIVGAALCALAPVLGNYWLNIFILIFLWGFLATAWNIIGGYCGQHSLGHGLYMGIGAYFTAFFFNRFNLSPWAGLFLALIIAGVVAWFIGWVIFRYQLKGAYFALVTIALTEAAVYVVSNVKSFGGAGGIQENLKSGLLWMQSDNLRIWYIAGVLMMVFGLLFAQFYSRQRFFYYLQAVRENDEAAEALGVDTVKEKIKANVVSGVLCALGGVFFVQYYLFVAPRMVFGETISVQILLFAIIGGLSTVWGPVVGAAILVPVGEITRSQWGTAFPGADLLIYGAVMVLVMLFMPYGILGVARRVQQRFFRRGPAQPVPAATPAAQSAEGGEA